MARTRWMLSTDRCSSRRPYECEPSRYRHGVDPPCSLCLQPLMLLTHATLLLLCVTILPVSVAAENVPPSQVKVLCSQEKDHKFITQDGQVHIFYKAGIGLYRCGDLWSISEDGRKVNDAATFYFNSEGQLLDVCQPLFAPRGCKKFENIRCDTQKNYCE